MLVTVIYCPMGTDRAALCLLYEPSDPLFETRNEPGPVTGALEPVEGKEKLTDVAVRPGFPGFEKNGPTLPPGQAQKRSTATPFATSNPVPPSVTVAPWATTVSTFASATPGFVLSAAMFVLSIAVILGNPAPAEPSRRLPTGSDDAYF